MQLPSYYSLPTLIFLSVQPQTNTHTDTHTVCEIDQLGQGNVTKIVAKFAKMLQKLRHFNLPNISIFAHFQTAGHSGFINDTEIRFIDKTDPSDPTTGEDF